MENGVLQQVDFEGQSRSLNFEGFTNLQKGITEIDFQLEYPAEKFAKLSRAGVDKLMADIVEKANGAEEFEKSDEGKELEKSETEKRPTALEVIEQGKELMSRFQAVSVIEKGEAIVYYMMPNDIEKGGEGSKGGKVIGHTRTGKAIYSSKEKTNTKREKLVDEYNKISQERYKYKKTDKNKYDSYDSKLTSLGEKIGKLGKKLEKGEINDLEKGEINDALGYNTKINKTGKEIAEKLAIIKTKVRTKVATLIGEKAALVKKIGIAPTVEMDEWDERGIEDSITVGMKRYPWEMTYYRNEGSGVNSAMPDFDMTATAKTPVKGQIISATSEDQATMASQYNRKLRECLECYRDLNKAAVFLRNVDEKKSYELSLNELDALGF